MKATRAQGVLPQKAISATIDLRYVRLILRLVLRLPALIFTSVPRNNCKMIVNPANIDKCISVSFNRITNVHVALLSS